LIGTIIGDNWMWLGNAYFSRSDISFFGFSAWSDAMAGATADSTSPAA